MKKISVLGCGWLGLPLSQFLLYKGFIVKGSTTSLDKLNLINDKIEQVFLIKAEENEIEGDVDLFFECTDILIINIPPKLRAGIESNYVSRIERILEQVKKHNIKKVLYVSSTSVFPDDNLEYDENKVPIPYSSTSKQLIEAENLVKNAAYFSSTIIRFGGLIGENRHPVTYMSAKDKEVENPCAPINLIHLEDCIGLIFSIIIQEKWGFIFHGVSPFHPSKKEYYSNEAKKRGLEVRFLNDQISWGKKVNSNLTLCQLGYNMIKPEL